MKKSRLKVIISVLVLALFLASCDSLVAPIQERENPLDPNNTLDPDAIQLYSSSYDTTVDLIKISWEYPVDTSNAPKTVLIIRRNDSSPNTSIPDLTNFPGDVRSFITTDNTDFTDANIPKETTFFYSIFWSMDTLTELETETIGMTGPISKEVRLVPGVQQTMTLNSDVDGFVDNMNPMGNYGDTFLKAYISTYNEISLIKFDTNFLNLNVVSSYLRLNVSSPIAMPRSAEINRITLDWVESDSNLWSDFSPNGNVDTLIVSSINIMTSMTGYVESDVTGIVSDWSHGSDNFGFRIKNSGSDDINFSSFESADKPELEINYNSYYLE